MFFRVAIAAGLGILFSSTAHPGDLDACKGISGTIDISACARLSTSKGLTADELMIVRELHALGHLEKGDYAGAIAQFSKLIELHPTAADPYIGRGVSHIKNGTFESAIADFGRAIRLNPTLAVPYASRAEAYKALQKYDAAVADYDAALRIDGSNAEYYRARGSIHSANQEHAKAVVDYTAALRLNPTDPLAWMARGLARVRMTEHDLAIADLNEAIRLDKTLSHAYVVRGNAHEDSDQLELALSDYKLAAAFGFDKRAALESVRRLEQKLARRPAVLERSGPRVAFVVGNGKYAAASPLRNPATDAADIATVLRKLGFDVHLAIDLTKTEFDAKLRDFAKALNGSATAVFYYGGHGVQISGRNYLIPIDANPKSTAELFAETIDFDRVLAILQADEQRVSLVFLDACRDNPLKLAPVASSTRGFEIGVGLAGVETGRGTLISYATAPNSVALDGKGRNSPFAAALKRHLTTKGIDISAVMRRVAADVVRESNGSQTPWTHSSLIGDVVLAGTARHVEGR